MTLKLTATAERQVFDLPEADYARVAAGLDLLERFPHLGKAYAQESPFSEKGARYFVVRVSRRRSYRITYRAVGADTVVLYVFPATYPLTHPDHLQLHRGKK